MVLSCGATVWPFLLKPWQCCGDEKGGTNEEQDKWCVENMHKPICVGVGEQSAMKPVCSDMSNGSPCLRDGDCVHTETYTSYCNMTTRTCVAWEKFDTGHECESDSECLSQICFNARCETCVADTKLRCSSDADCMHCSSDAGCTRCGECLTTGKCGFK